MPPAISLIASRVDLGGDDFKLIVNWPYNDSFVARVLKSDIPQRVKFGNGRIWLFKDPMGQPVGFGTFDVCEDYGHHTHGKPHPYIPLLAVNPTIKSLGYGTSIVEYLVAEAALTVKELRSCSDVLFLDVYTNNTRAIALYTRTGFQQLEGPINDPDEGAQYIIMGRRVSVANE